MHKICFNSANLVGRATGYECQLSQWGKHAKLTVERTDENEWRSICREIAEAGYRAIEIWEAHASPETLNETRAKKWRNILDENGLTPVAYAGGLRPETAQICQWLGIPHADAGFALSVDATEELCRESGIRYNFENHPEKSVAEILDKVAGGSDNIGVCVDTGWLGTQGANVPGAIRELGSLIRHVHLKDVLAPGGHETCLLGEGSANIAGCVVALKEIGYDGWYSWEDEPEARNPMESAARNREYIEKLLSA